MYDVVEVRGKTTAEKIFGILNRADGSESDGHSISQVERARNFSFESKSYNGRDSSRSNLAIRQGEKSSSRAKWLWNQLFSEWSQGRKADAGTITCRQGMELKQVILFVR